MGAAPTLMFAANVRAMTSDPAVPPVTTERDPTNGMQELVRAAGLCGAYGNGRVCILKPHEGPHGFEGTPDAVDQGLVAAIFHAFESADWDEVERADGDISRGLARIAASVVAAEVGRARGEERQAIAARIEQKDWAGWTSAPPNYGLIAECARIAREEP